MHFVENFPFLCLCYFHWVVTQIQKGNSSNLYKFAAAAKLLDVMKTKDYI
jgi:hypothetical protein